MRNPNVPMYTLVGMIMMVGCGGPTSGTDATVAPASGVGDESQATTTGALGPNSGLLSRDKLVLGSVIQVDLSNETVRLPLYKGTANGHTVWYILTESSDPGLAEDSGLNYAPKLANMADGCPECVQTVT